MHVQTNTELGNDSVPQLYDLAADPGEKRNVADRFPDRVKEMGARLDEIRKAGRSRPGASAQNRPRPPNILLAIADDWSYPHASAYGDAGLATPAFDRVAREGALFTSAFTAAPSCTPSRAALLTGQAVHRLAEGGNLHGFLPSRFEVYPDLLERAGYHVGFTGKGWGPGQFEPGGRSRNPAGPRYASFEEFLAARREGQPFVFWYGSTDPHRPYDPGTGAGAGLRPERASVPASLPDTPEVRGDILDYYFEVQRFDSSVAHLLDLLQRSGELDNTIVVVTSDNGMPFPRAKANLYDAGTRMPLAVRWPTRIKAGTRIDELVSLTDLAPTFLEAAGLPVPSAMTGRSLLPLLTSPASSQRASRPAVFVERERHANVRRGDLSYPARAIRTSEYLYIHNYRPDRWPAGDPEMYFAVGPFGDIDDGPAKQLLLKRRSDSGIARYFELATAKRPADELFDLRKDPAQLVNVAGDPAYAPVLQRLQKELASWQRETADPRATSDDDRWDRYPYYGAPAKQEGRGGR
jgi:arylsulfatase A-like enzyme